MEEKKEFFVSESFAYLERLPDRVRSTMRRNYRPISRTVAEIDRVVICGVGLSALSGRLLEAACVDRMKKPLVVSPMGLLPGFVDEKSLVVLISYSGDTSEIVASMEEAIRREACVIAVTKGGKLARLARKNDLMVVRVTADRLVGLSPVYMFSLLVGVLSSAGVLDNPRPEVMEAVVRMKEMRGRLMPHIDLPFNQAKTIAEQLYRAIPLIWGSGPDTNVAARMWKSLFHINAKTPAISGWFPDVAYTDMAGFQEPRDLLKRFAVVLLKDGRESERTSQMVLKSMELIRDRVKTVIHVEGMGDTALSRLLTLIYIGEFVSCYLASFYGTDLMEVDLIADLKAKLAE